MKITYNENPLATTVELDATEKKELWYKIKIQELEDLISSAHFSLKEGQFFDLQRAKEDLDPEYFYSEELNKRCDMLLEHFVKELQSSHLGDCTCAPSTCCKCTAEALLGIDTIPGLNKHAGYKIWSLFKSGAILDTVIYKLKPHTNSDTDGWKADGDLAYDWLINYKNILRKKNENIKF